jgi:hypothetical protein
VAQRFGVSYDYVKKIRQQQLRTGRMVRTPQSCHGRFSRVGAGAHRIERCSADLQILDTMRPESQGQATAPDFVLDLG